MYYGHNVMHVVTAATEHLHIGSTAIANAAVPIIVGTSAASQTDGVQQWVALIVLGDLLAFHERCCKCEEPVRKRSPRFVKFAPDALHTWNFVAQHLSTNRCFNEIQLSSIRF